jgi:general secretion pathway protein K
VTRRARHVDERGFALLAVLLVMALLGVVGAEFAYSMRLEATAVRSFKDGVTATHLAEAGVEQGIREIAADSTYVGLDDQGVLTFYGRDLGPLPRLPRDKVPLGGGQFSYRISDEEARLSVNSATPDRLHRLLQHLGVDKSARDVIIDSIQDWRDPNDEHRLNGAESDDYYLKLPVPYRARNANIESLAELQQIRGITPALYKGADGKPGLVDLLTVKTPGQVNLNTASEAVLRAYGLGDAEVSLVTQARRIAPLAQLPGQFGGRGFITTTRTFRIEADGLVDGQVRASITAVVQRRTSGGVTGLTVAVLEWSGAR